MRPNEGFLWDWLKEQGQILPSSILLDISVINSKIVYGKIQSTAAMSSMDFRFSLARSMIGTFSNKKRAIPTTRPSKRSKGEIAIVVDHLPQFAATRARCAYCSLNKLENHTFIQCMKCHIPLCLQKERNCFYEHHIQQYCTSNTKILLKGFAFLL